MLYHGIEIKEGMFIQLTGMETKNDNDIFIVASDYAEEGKYAKCSNECCLKKVKLNGELSNSKYTIVFIDKGTDVRNPNISLKVISDLKQGKKEVNAYLKNRENAETVVEFEPTEETVKTGSIVKFEKGLKCGTFGEKYYGTKRLWRVEFLENGKLKLSELGKKGQNISTGETTVFSLDLTKLVLNENYLKVYDLVETLKGDLKENKPTTTVTKDVKPSNDTNTLEQQTEAVTPIESSENSDKMDNMKVVYNEEKNGIELYFDGKPSEEIRLILKANGFRWAKFNKAWYIKDTNEARDFIQSFTGSGSDDAETITLESVNNDIQIVELENYTISPELSRRENDGNWIFRTKEVDHNSELQSLFNSILERVNDMLPNLSELEQLKLKRNFNYFVKSYHTNRIKELTLKVNTPNWAVTGRSGRNMNKYNKDMERLNTIQRDGMKLYNIMIEKLEKYERKIKKAS